METLPLERDIQRDCLRYLKARGIFAFRCNNVGVYNPKADHYRFHGLRGVSDILGIVPQTCSHATQGLFLAIEVKRPGKNPTPDQKRFIDEIIARGGIAGCVHSVDELQSLLDRYV